MACAICGPAPFSVRFEARLPAADTLDFSARRTPERLHCRVVRCDQCGLVFSNPYFAEETVRSLYATARYIEESQLRNMATDYLRELRRSLPTLPRDARILEVGCGNGFFLHAMQEAGFTNSLGIEPGADAVRRAPASVRERIRNEFFNPDQFEPGTFDLVCCFQVFDHVLDPNAFVGGFARLLRPGGHLFAINHNIRSWSARVLGERSPMYDIEHVYLFNRDTIKRLVQKHGLSVVRCAAIANSYAIEYLLKMMPLPSSIKPAAQGLVELAGVSRWQVAMSGGNMVTTARKNGIVERR